MTSKLLHHFDGDSSHSGISALQAISWMWRTLAISAQGSAISSYRSRQGHACPLPSRSKSLDDRVSQQLPTVGPLAARGEGFVYEIAVLESERTSLHLGQFTISFILRLLSFVNQTNRYTPDLYLQGKAQGPGDLIFALRAQNIANRTRCTKRFG